MASTVIHKELSAQVSESLGWCLGLERGHCDPTFRRN